MDAYFLFFFHGFKKQVAIKLHSLHGSTTRTIMVGKVNGAAEKALASRFSVNKYPCFYLIDGWTVREYEGNRSVDDLINFATKSYTKYEVSQAGTAL